MTPKAMDRHTAEITDPLTGEIVVLEAGSGDELDAAVEAWLADRFELPVDQGAGSAAGAGLVRQVLRVVTSVVGTSTRLIDVANLDGQLVRIEIGCGPAASGNVQVIAQVEQRLRDVLPGRWEAGWNTAAASVVLRPITTR